MRRLVLFDEACHLRAADGTGGLAAGNRVLPVSALQFGGFGGLEKWAKALRNVRVFHLFLS